MGTGRRHTPPLWEAMAEAGMQYIETYVVHIQNTAAKYIATRPIMDLCLAEGRSPGVRVLKSRWEQENLNMGGIQVEEEKWD